MPCDPHLKRLLKAQVSHKFSRRNRKKKFARKGTENLAKSNSLKIGKQIILNTFYKQTLCYI